jgi:Acetamidase/Formamidase family
VKLEEIHPNRETCWSRIDLSPSVLDPDFVVQNTPTAGKVPKETCATWRIDRAPRTVSWTSTATSGPYGGNMDWRGARNGMRLYFPCFMERAMLYLGDCHATQSDGKICGTGTEVSARVKFSVEIEHGVDIRRLCGKSYQIDRRLVDIMLGQCARYEIANVFDPVYTVVCKIPEQVVSSLLGPRDGAEARGES